MLVTGLCIVYVQGERDFDIPDRFYDEPKCFCAVRTGTDVSESTWKTANGAVPWTSALTLTFFCPRPRSRWSIVARHAQHAQHAQPSCRCEMSYCPASSSTRPETQSSVSRPCSHGPTATKLRQSCACLNFARAAAPETCTGNA